MYCIVPGDYRSQRAFMGYYTRVGIIHGGLFMAGKKGEKDSQHLQSLNSGIINVLH